MKRLSILLYVLVFALIGVIFFYTDLVNLLLRGDIQGLRDEIASYGLLAPAISLSLMVLQAIISPIPAVVLYIVNGLLFGLLAGFVISWFGALASAWLCFWLVRTLSLDVVVSGNMMNKVNALMERFGSRGVFLARIAPFMPTDLASYAFGLTSLSTKQFMVGTALGQTPAIGVYAWFGAGGLSIYWYVLVILLWSGIAFGLMKLAEKLVPRLGGPSIPGSETPPHPPKFVGKP